MSVGPGNLEVEGPDFSPGCFCMAATDPGGGYGSAAAMDEDRLLSRKELAAALGVSTRTVDRWIREQTGPPATLLPSGRRRWRWGDVEAWLRQRREDG